MLKIFKNSLDLLRGKRDNRTEKDEESAEMVQTSTSKISNISNFVNQKINEVTTELTQVKEKSKNLRQTNYDLGMKHLNNGYIGDAIFRFRFIIKFWPDLYDAYYQLAYCLTLKKKYSQAESVLKELLQKNPNFDPKAKELLEKIKNQ